MPTALAPPSPPLVRTVAVTALAVVLPLALVALVAPALRVPPLASLGIAYVAATVALVGGVARSAGASLGRVRTGLAVLVGGLVLAALGTVIARAGHASTMADVASGLIGSLGVVLAGSSLGSIVGSRIAHPGHLLAVVLASSAADLWSVHAPEGITHAVVASNDVALQRLVCVSAAIPPGRAPDAVIGLGDVIFVALYLAASQRHALPRTRTLGAVTVGLLLACAATFVARRPLAALPFVGACVVLAQPAARRVARGDRFPTLVAAALLVATGLRFAWQWYRAR